MQSFLNDQGQEDRSNLLCSAGKEKLEWLDKPSFAAL